MPSQTLNPSLDGFVLNSPGFGTSWATTVGAASGTSHAENSTATWLACADTPTFGSPSCYRGFFLFDTSVLPDDATVTGAIFRVKASAAPYGTGYIRLYGPATPASDSALANADFNDHGANVWSDDLTIAGFSSGATRDFTLNAAGIAGINITGMTRFAARTSWDYGTTSPGVDVTAGVLVYYNDAATAGDRPQLIITYTSPLVELTGSDSGTGTEGTATVIVTSYPVASDSATGSDGSSVNTGTASKSASDSGTATDGSTVVNAVVSKSASETGTGTDASSPVAVQVGSWVGDNTAAGPGPWLFGEVNPQTPHDEGVATDSGLATNIVGAISKTASDSGSATDTGARTSVIFHFSAFDSGVGVDSSGNNTDAKFPVRILRETYTTSTQFDSSKTVSSSTFGERTTYVHPESLIEFS